ncbi:hypothetical protein WKW50_00320 [Ochrobactrum sp. GPK 3]|jgi:hypothetical protein|uniref:Uncharacterized protein n=1 Tax=Brucella haematophila TaxID=419474 RepID=A0ABX1DLJ3_9HYPH|nr:hypothetical protein [Brucella haematophila]KAB2701121.1 hypothetical protein F9K79_02585 [Ochrobactrum sp. Kaboul]MBA8819961.1 hypothetical protein [Ochrobactrum sp. P6BSIII]MDH7784573.1 hypothetical protein [Ochrobactrum sp. 19YEA23]OOL18506.1 hypothetical protein BRY73_05925 [Ochrobactrum sp. P6BS-III]NKC03293.1 hypothetical protein [Brucella haematophila]
MSEKPINQERQNQLDRQKKRLADQLRANLMRRKEQSRSRRSGEADERNDGISTAGKETE